MIAERRQQQELEEKRRQQQELEEKRRQQQELEAKRRQQQELEIEAVLKDIYGEHYNTEAAFRHLDFMFDLESSYADEEDEFIVTKGIGYTGIDDWPFEFEPDFNPDIPDQDDDDDAGQDDDDH